MTRNARWIDRGPENRQHGNKPHFTRVSLPFSAGNTAATGGNILLVFGEIFKAQRAQKLTDHGKPGKPRNTRTTRTTKARNTRLISVWKIGNIGYILDSQRVSRQHNRQQTRNKLVTLTIKLDSDGN
jgi:hypothetical protein